MAFVKLLAAKVTSNREELVVLQHLLLERLRQTNRAQDARVDLSGKLVVRSSGSDLGIALFELLNNLSGRVVSSGTVDALSKDLFPVEEDALDKLASVMLGGKKRHGRVRRSRKAEAPIAVWHLSDRHARKIGHEITSKEEGGRNTNLANVGLYLCFAVKVVDILEFAASDW